MTYRLIIWGPGEVGGAVARAAHARPEFEIVGAKVFSAGKDGRDLGELVGLGPIGVRATTSKDEILATEADCVIVTPRAAFGPELDADVIDLLESGKNVISTASYHNAAMPNWLSATRPPASRLLQACRTGGVSLHGTGVHPTFMVERLAMTMTHAVADVTHLRCVEAVDFAAAPEGMWGGLHKLGFGRDPASISGRSPLAMFGDLYYGALAGNVAHALHGADMSEVRVEHDLRGLPAKERLRTRSGFVVEAGTVAALHMTHRGYLGDRHFFTNEECWYLGEANAYRGDDLPFDGADGAGPINYVIEIRGGNANLRTRLAFEPTARGNPVTDASVLTILDAVPAICAAEPGILIDDSSPRYKHDDRIDLSLA
jgi:hypothetical protein